MKSARIISYFFVGLIIGTAGMYIYHRDRALNREIEALKHQVANVRQPVSQETSLGNGSDTGYGFNPGALPPSDIETSRQTAITRAISRTADAVVGINVTQVREVVARSPFYNDPFFRTFSFGLPQRVFRQKVENLGSGFLISQDGYIVTNEHVVRGAIEIVVTTTSGQRFNARIVGTDPLLDVALLKIETYDLPYIEWGNSDQTVIGEWVIAIGNPYGLFAVNDKPSVTVGVISALHRDFDRNEDGRIYSDMIQTDASINRGNSGGPLVNAQGQAIGMNTMIFTEGGGSLGIGFAMPASRIRSLIDELLMGGVKRNYWIGIVATDLNRMMAISLGLDSTEGAVVSQVEPQSPSDKAGIEPADVILEINGKSIANARAARALLSNTDLRVGDSLSFKIFRYGKILDISITLEELPERTG
ncbi:trypsin-like peptidase domain-containing protein, partial [bacterium]|nr:trypsin-like peptidase domain-containing protein [bacterium]